MKNNLTRPEISKLRKRWTELETKKANQEIASSVHQDTNREALIDFRGLHLLVPMKWNHVVGADFSYCHASFREDGNACFLHTTLTSCRFIGADLSDMNAVVHAKLCEFDYVKFNVLGDEFEDCSFVGAKIERPVGRSVFRRCDFSEMDWRKVDAQDMVFDNCKWDGCRFGFGSFAGSSFVGTKPDDAALGDTIMDDVRYE